MFVDVWNTLALSCWREAAPEVPMHIAITMDGNGRWAQKRGKPRLHGHRAGAETASSNTLCLFNGELEASECGSTWDIPTS